MAKIKLVCPLGHENILADDKRLSQFTCKTCKKKYAKPAKEEPKPATLEELTIGKDEETEKTINSDVYKENTLEVEQSTSSTSLKPQTDENAISISNDTTSGVLFKPAVVKGFLKTIFHIIALRRGSFWELTDDELDQITPLAVRLANKHLGSKVPSKYSDEIAFALAFGVIVVGKVMSDKDASDKRKKEATFTPIQNTEPVEVPTIPTEPVKFEDELKDKYPTLSGSVRK